MMIKLFIAKIVTTPFYLTLDADIIFLRDIRMSDLLDSSGRAIYHHEGRYDGHPAWWDGSEALLRIPTNNDAILQGMHVTPAVLSTFGSLLAIRYMLEVHGDEYETIWLKSLSMGQLWSEYTMYRIVLDQFHLFELLHFPQQNQPTNSFNLHCFDVWYVEELPWKSEQAASTNCLSSVVQSSTRVSASILLAQFESIQNH